MLISHYRESSLRGVLQKTMFSAFYLYAFAITIMGVSLLSRMVQTCDPNILVGYVGSSINIPCTENSKCNAITWSHTRLIKGGDPLVNPLSRSNDTDESGTCYLRISSAELQDAGKYECIHRRGAPPACISHVVIIESTLKCQINTPTSSTHENTITLIENDILVVSCEFKYNGHGTQLLTWIGNIHGGRSPSQYVLSDSNFKNTVRPLNEYNPATFTVHSTLSLKARRAKRGSIMVQDVSAEERLTCDDTEDSDDIPTQQYTLRLGLSSSDTSNYPSTAFFNVNWTSPLIVVQYGVKHSRSQVLIPNTNTVDPGVTLLCCADGNPLPSYHWIMVADNTTLGSDSTITVKQPENFNYQCIATNFVNGTVFTAVSSPLQINVNTFPSRCINSSDEAESKKSSMLLSRENIMLLAIVLLSLFVTSTLVGMMMICVYYRKQITKLNYSLLQYKDTIAHQSTYTSLQTGTYLQLGNRSEHRTAGVIVHAESTNESYIEPNDSKDYYEEMPIFKK